MNIIQHQKEATVKLFENHHVNKLYASGSVLTDNFSSSNNKVNNLFMVKDAF